MSVVRVWKSRGGRGFGPAPFLCAGIVNVTPDSFSDGGRFDSPEKAAARCRALLKEGADILDLGGESTRPGSAPISAEEELERLMPTVEACVAMRDAAQGESFRIGVDTWRARTAAAVLEAGVDIINDVSGGAFDPAMIEVVAEYKPGYVLTHTPARPEVMREHARYDSVVDTVVCFFENAVRAFTDAGLSEENIILDPGIGFGKTAEQNLDLLRETARLHSLGRPLYIGLSRKRMFGDLLGLPLGNRDAATQVATAFLASRGVYAHRVHDVAGARVALNLAMMLA